MQTKHSLKVILVSSLLLLTAGWAQAQIQDRPNAGPEQKKMEVRAGEWKYEGVVSDTLFGPGGKFAGKQTNRMILDGLFMESRNEDKGVYGGKEIVYKAVGMQWYDSTTKTYHSQGFDNDGMVGRSVTTVNGNTWTDTGTMTDSKGKTYKTRASSTYSPDGKTIVTKCELSTDDGKTWIAWWESTAKKTGK
jgi:hypothetical protein